MLGGWLPYRLRLSTHQRPPLSQRGSNEKELRRALPPVAGVLVLIDCESLRVDGCFSQYLILRFRVDAENKKAPAVNRGLIAKRLSVLCDRRR